MNNRMILHTLFLLILSANIQAGPEHQHNDRPPRAETVLIDADMARRSGLRVAEASAGRIERHLPLYGELVIPPSQRAQVRARFPGLITAITVSVGDKVKPGQVLAYVESNDSLRRYPLMAPIGGTVVQQFANQGEYSAGEPILLLADTAMLWAELKLFPAMFNEVISGLPVHIETRAGRYDSSVMHIAPAADKPYAVARVMLQNNAGRYAPGERVSALVDADVISLPLVIDNLALQQFEGKPVVFVREDDYYQPRALTLGRTDGRYSEVLSGLHAGEQYVVANSYLVKAELEKSAAAHSH